MAAATTLQAAPIDLIIDTDPGADDVVALFLAMASPDELNIRAITTVAGNVRLEKPRATPAWPANGPAAKTSPCTPAARPLVRKPIYAADVHGEEGLTGIQVHEPKAPLARAMPCNTWSTPWAPPSPTASPSPCSAHKPTWPWR